MELIQASNLARALMAEHLDTSWSFIWDHAQKRGGQCRYQRRTISLSRYLVPLWTEAQVREVILHEIAHALVGPYVDAHGTAWRRTALSIGSTGDRTHAFATVPGQWRAVCPECGPKQGRYRRRRSLFCRKCWETDGSRNTLSYIPFDSVPARV